ncbi:MAG: PVC-type heme-binding CxxCH protein [bacterium]
MMVPQGARRGSFAGLLLFTLSGCESDRDDTLQSFQIHPDFQIELVAKEPLVTDPVDMEFDEHGRAFVIEMTGYPFMTEKSKVILLQDKNDDGIYDHRTVFADELNFADSILPYREGLLVAAPPHLLFLKDTDGNNIADMREVLLNGFAVENPQHNFNGLTHGLDNWIYGANGGNSGNVYWQGDSLNRIPLRDDDFRFNLERKKFERIGTSAGGYGIALDDWGRVYGTHNLEHISLLVFPGRYLAGVSSPHGGTRTLISDHEEGGLARIFPIGVQDTRVNHPEQSGYFSGACGITYYGGGAFPAAFNGNIFVADVVLNLVHQDVLYPRGAGFAASRGMQRKDFLASSDRAFRPVNMTVGPDGALYVLDMYRAVIEHPEWIPDDIEKNLDLRAGKDQGRIYRITPRAGVPRLKPSFPRNDLASVVAKLGHHNKWWRDTAQRLLLQWRDYAAVAPLENTFVDSDEPRARLHALWTLHGLNALKTSFLLKALNDAHAGVRENALFIAEETLTSVPEVLGVVLNLARDPEARVRMQVALTLSTLDSVADAGVAGRIQEALFAVAAQDANDQWTRLAIVCGAKNDPLPLLQRLLAAPSGFDSSGAKALVTFLAQQVGQRDNPVEVADLLRKPAAPTGTSNEVLAAMLEGLAAGLEIHATNVPRKTFPATIHYALDRIIASDSAAAVHSAWRVKQALGLKPSVRQRELLHKAAALALNSSAATALRLEALGLLEFADFAQREMALYQLLDSKHPQALQAAAMAQLGRVSNQFVGQKLLAKWKYLGPEARAQAGDILLYRAENHDLLLTALEKREITLGELNFHLERLRTLLFSDEASIRRRAEALFSDAGVLTRKEAMDKMRPALALPGNAQKGQDVYSELCAKCHRLGNAGEDLGPNLTEIFRKSSESLLHDIIDPNAAMETKYVSYVVQTHQGEFVTGMVAGETDEEVAILVAGAERRIIRRDQIKEMSASGISMMPEGLEDGMSSQTMADLLAFLMMPR